MSCPEKILELLVWSESDTFKIEIILNFKCE